MSRNAQAHQSDPRVLKRRTLASDHRRLAGMLRPGMAVLDAGCGTGAITAGIAEAVQPGGYAVGVERDPGLLALAQADHAERQNLRFEAGDAANLRYRNEFDIVTAARTLQWIADPAGAIRSLIRATKPGGLLVALDYNHANNEWEPDPPLPFQRFYHAFLAWREANGWDNRMADHLPELFVNEGLAEVAVYVEDEVTKRGDADFTERSLLWSEVIGTVGPPIAAAGFCTEPDLHEAQASYLPWVPTGLTKQTLAMRTIVGVKPWNETLL